MIKIRVSWKNMKKFAAISPTTVRLITAALFLCMGITIGVWDYAQQSVSDYIYTETMESDDTGLSIQTADDIINEPVDETLDVKSGDTFSTVLKRTGVSTNQIYAILEALKTVFDPRDLRTDHKIFATFNSKTEESSIREITKLIISLSLEQEIVVELDDANKYSAQKVEKQLEHDYKHAEGQIETSLYVDAIKQGAHPKIIHEMIQAFSYDVDFQRGFQSGDSFSLLFDYFKDPETLGEKPGNIIFAKLKLRGQDVCIYRHKHKNGTIQFFNEKGEAIKKGLLMTPVDGARISSTYGRRKHPVLGYSKMHKGVDFAAPRGTPIMAAGAGKITKIGRLGSYGNYIRIRHNGTYDTAYAHMSKFAKGLRVGSSLRQGQIIGYVGQTGRATGNHLHYELLKNGQQINPKHVKMLPASKLVGTELQRFMANKDIIDKRIQSFQKEAQLDSQQSNDSSNDKQGSSDKSSDKNSKENKKDELDDITLSQSMRGSQSVAP